MLAPRPGRTGAATAREAGPCFPPAAAEHRWPRPAPSTRCGSAAAMRPRRTSGSPRAGRRQVLAARLADPVATPEWHPVVPGGVIVLRCRRGGAGAVLGRADRRAALVPRPSPSRLLTANRAARSIRPRPRRTAARRSPPCWRYATGCGRTPVTHLGGARGRAVVTAPDATPPRSCAAWRHRAVLVLLGERAARGRVRPRTAGVAATVGPRRCSDRGAAAAGSVDFRGRTPGYTPDAAARRLLRRRAAARRPAGRCSARRACCATTPWPATGRRAGRQRDHRRSHRCRE